MSQGENRHTDLNGLLSLDSRSIMAMNESSVISIPDANQLGITQNADALQAQVSVRQVSDYEILIEARVDLSCLDDFDLNLQD